MSPAINEFERRVLAGTLRHPNNPIADWCVGNVVMRDIGATGQIMLDRRRSTSRIDYVTASCIALTALLAGEDVYTAQPLWL
jgi:phage terminase large subunit-like protein